MAHAVKCQERRALLAQSLSFPCMDEKDCEPVWAAVIMLSVALCTATQLAVQASLQLSSHSLSDLTVANLVQNVYLWSRYHFLLDLTVTIEAQLLAF